MKKIADSLLAIARREYEKAWGDDNGMVEHCLNRMAAIVPLEKGGYCILEKPQIQTKFYYGYGQNGIADEDEQDFAYACCAGIRKRDAFIKHNLEEYLDGHFLDSRSGYVHRQSFPRFEGVMLREVIDRETWERWYRHIPALPVTDNDRRNINNAVRGVCEDSRKRLETYWKRYGDSKLKTHVYLVD